MCVFFYLSFWCLLNGVFFSGSLLTLLAVSFYTLSGFNLRGKLLSRQSLCSANHGSHRHYNNITEPLQWGESTHKLMYTRSIHANVLSRCTLYNRRHSHSTQINTLWTIHPHIKFKNEKKSVILISERMKTAKMNQSTDKTYVFDV